MIAPVTPTIGTIHQAKAAAALLLIWAANFMWESYCPNGLSKD